MACFLICLEHIIAYKFKCLEIVLVNEATSKMATKQATPQPMTDVSGFRRDVLRAIEVIESADELSSGSNIGRFLEEHYASVDNGRIYPALTSLVDAGLIERSEVDGRTNQYELTTEGREQLANHRAYYTENNQ